MKGQEMAEKTTLKAKELMTLGKSKSGPRSHQSKFQSLLHQKLCDLPGLYRLHVLIPWGVDTCVSACLASMLLYSSISTLAFLCQVE